ncbi:MAG: hypothetical protein K9N09_12270 [Candidatus Cloacimonetes bacterium]|nr:hypothetical protein [Candidatus Cloacimonadota bacterium]MCF7884828.1 hypothetical protein [Candidatus Cloacimonadota bacterium]
MKKNNNQVQTKNIRTTDDYYKISHSILMFAGKRVSTEVFLQESLSCLKKVIDYSIVDLWIKNKEQQYYIHYDIGDETSFSIERYARDKEIDTTEKYPDFKELIETVQDFKVNSSNSNYKTPTHSSIAIKDRSIEINGKKVKSCAVVVVFNNNEIQGLMVIFSAKNNEFNDERLEFLENIFRTLNIALNHLHTQIILNERVKELICLYGIAQLGENFDLSLEIILQKIVELLPPAWQYPKLATARITLDGKYYTSPNFTVNGKKQFANILISGVKRGTVEVIYPSFAIGSDDSLFLAEEQDLIEIVSREIAGIVERRIADEEKEKLENQLRHADRLATIGQLSAGVAHELNEPLANILGFAQLLQKGENLKKQQLTDIDSIIKSSLHAREIIKKLMLFSRQMPPQKTKVNLNQLIENGLYFLMSRCEKNGIKVTREFSKDIREIVADSSQLYQVLVNLVVNAIHAMPDGGEIKISTSGSSNKVSFSVEDNGVGMSDETLKQIFIPFFTTKDITEGTGLGLAVVHGIVSSHGGSIKVDSKQNEGSKFEVVLPVTQ